MDGRLSKGEAIFVLEDDPQDGSITSAGIAAFYGEPVRLTAHKAASA